MQRTSLRTQPVGSGISSSDFPFFSFSLLRSRYACSSAEWSLARWRQRVRAAITRRQIVAVSAFHPVAPAENQPIGAQVLRQYFYRLG